jgi:DNA helicase-2/ATP-dependent DNA helicase PcrA
VAKRIRACSEVEAYLWPRVDRDWLAGLAAELSGEARILLSGFRDVARRWHLAANLPIDQLILTLANDIFQKPSELALVHKLAVLLRDVAGAHPSYRLPELVEELAVIARNERRFLGVSNEDTAFEPSQGEVTVATMHKAKGLEWDRVYLMSVNNYDFPSGLAHDIYQSESWFVRDHLNLQAEALAQLKVLASAESGSPSLLGVVEGKGTTRARLDYIKERLRLHYVGITRAERDLVITWNTGRRSNQKLQPAVPFVALHEFVQQTNREPGLEE